jgi:tetratricopeptide (TPR) repeat protein
MRATKIKPQWVLVTSGIILFSVLFIFGRTVPKKDKPAETQPVTAGALSFHDILSSYKQGLKPYQLDYLLRLENSVVRGDVKEQQIHVYHQLARFWQDSVKAFEPYAYYIGEAAKLENSEKSLTFAAHLLESRMMETDHAALQNWLATNAKVLFEKALAINPDNDSSKVGLGACYLFGNISDRPMEGILQVKAVADKDPGNIYAQKTLVFGSLKTGQYDKAIERLKIIIDRNPGDLEMLLLLGDTYERKGDKENAIIRYEAVSRLVKDPKFRQELQHHIEDLKK